MSQNNNGHSANAHQVPTLDDWVKYPAATVFWFNRSARVQTAVIAQRADDERRLGHLLDITTAIEVAEPKAGPVHRSACDRCHNYHQPCEGGSVGVPCKRCGTEYECHFGLDMRRKANKALRDTKKGKEGTNAVVDETGDDEEAKEEGTSQNAWDGSMEQLEAETPRFNA